jgi:FixJ family two-component response regulator
MIKNRLVYILDSDPDFCAGAGVLLKLEGLRAAAFTKLADFKNRVAKQAPDLALINFHHDGDWENTLGCLRQEHSATAVIMLADGPYVDLSIAAVRAGATDVLIKPIDTQHLMSTIADTFAGLVGRSYGTSLTFRERQVLELIARGCTAKEAGRELGISPRTVEVHRSHLMTKLGARNAADMIRMALQ